MASPRSAWGIDIGNRALKAVKLTRDGDAIRVEDFDFIEHETILSQAGDNRDDLIRHALETFVGRKSTKNAAVAVGVSGQTSFARFIKLPPVEAKQIPQIVKFEAIQQIPFPLDEVEWAYQLFQSPDAPDIECGIFAMRKELVNSWVGLFTSHDLNVQAVQTNPLAVYNAVQRDGRLTDGTAMVIDVGAENTDLIIASENSIWLRSIPIGGNSFTETIMKAFKLPAQKAEDLKRDAAGSKYYRQILQAMRPVFADLVAEIQRSIGFYASVNRENKINKIIALGGTFRMPSLPKYLQQNLQLEVERPDNFAAALPEDSKTAALLTENLLSLHAAYGLALQAMGETKVDSSLLPTAIRKRKMWQEKNKWFATAAAMCVAGTLVGAASYVMNSTAFASRESERGKADAILATAHGLDSEWKDVSGSGGPELQTIKNVNNIIANRDLWPSILTDIALCVPQPPADLAKALATGDVETIKKTPRAERKILQIDSLRSIYYPDLGPILRAPDLRAYLTEFAAGSTAMGTGYGSASSSGEAATAGGATAGERGFLVYAKLLSPNDKVETDLVTNDFLKRLASVVPAPAKMKTVYAFQRPEFIQSVRLSEDRDLVQRMTADYQAMQTAKTQADIPAAPDSSVGPPMGGMQGGMQGGPSDIGPRVTGPPMGAPYGGDQSTAGPANSDAEALKDRVTGEDMSRDKVIEVMFAIVLDPPAAAPGGAAASTDTAAPTATPAPAAGPPVPTPPPTPAPASGGGAIRLNGR